MLEHMLEEEEEQEEEKHAPNGKQIADTNVYQNHHSTTTKALDDPSSYQHGSIHTNSANNASYEKDEVRCQEHILASKDIRQFPPEWN
jgi:hypothetical protein